MGRVWTEEGKFRRWLEVELAATETLAETGVVPTAAAAMIRDKARIDGAVVKRIAELEAKVKHDVIAFTMAVSETIGDPDAARWLHYGLTSNDVVDTAQALQIREASRLIEHGLVRFGEVLERRGALGARATEDCWRLDGNCLASSRKFSSEFLAGKLR